jgi:hypothetical protein
LSARSSPQPLYPRIVLLILCTSALISLASAVTVSPGEMQSTIPDIAKGDQLTIRGNTTGQPPNGLMLWIVGDNYAKTFLVQVNGDNTYSSTIKSGDTAKLASGEYLVLVQNPGANGRFDIIYKADDGSVVNLQPAWMQVTYRAGPIQLRPEDDTSDADADTVIRYPLDGGTKIFQLASTGNSSGTGAGSSLIGVLDSQNVDDTFTSASFAVSDPDAFIIPIPNHAVGDRFTINGTTNLAVGDTLNVEVAPSSFALTTKQQSGEFSGSSGRVTVVPGAAEYNCWTYMVDTTGFRPDTYVVRVSGILQEARGTATFNLLDHLPAAVVTTSSATTAEPGTTQPGSATPSPTTQESPLLPAAGAWGLAGAFFLYRAGKRP